MALLFRVADRGSCALFYLVVALAPLPLGSTEPAMVAIWCVVLGVTVILASVLEIRTPQLVFIGLAAVLALMYGVVLHEQLSVHPWFASPHPIWKETAETAADSDRTIGVDRAKPTIVCDRRSPCGIAVLSVRASGRCEP